MRDISKEANLSLGAIYVYFETKNGILKTLVEKGSKEMQTLLNPNGENSLEHFLEILAEQMNKPNGMEGFRTDIGIWAVLLDDDELRNITEASVQEFLNQLVTLLNLDQDHKTLATSYDSELRARVILGIIQGGAVQKTVDPDLDIVKYFKAAFSLMKLA